MVVVSATSVVSPTAVAVSASAKGVVSTAATEMAAASAESAGRFRRLVVRLFEALAAETRVASEATIVVSAEEVGFTTG